MIIDGLVVTGEDQERFLLPSVRPKIAALRKEARALGIERTVDVERHQFTVKPADIYLLCSDGLSDLVDDTEITDVLVDSGSTLERAGSDLVARANALGGLDNISVILLRIDALAAETPGLLGRVLDWVR